MTTEQRKEKIFKKFKETCCYKEMESESVRYPSEVFDFFYSEIESRDKRAELYEYEVEALKRVVREYEAERRHLEEIIKAADEVIKCYPKEGLSEKYGYDHEQALEKYNKLKSKLPSGI